MNESARTSKVGDPIGEDSPLVLSILPTFSTSFHKPKIVVRFTDRLKRKGIVDVVEQLTLIKGSIEDTIISFLTEEDTQENFTNVDKANLEIRRDITDSTSFILKRDSVTGNLTIDTAKAKLTLNLTQTESDNLVIGNFIGSIGVHFTSPEAGWKITHPFKVRIIPDGVVHI